MSGVGNVNTLLGIELVKLVEIDKGIFAIVQELGEGVGTGV